MHADDDEIRFPGSRHSQILRDLRGIDPADFHRRVVGDAIGSVSV